MRRFLRSSAVASGLAFVLAGSASAAQVGTPGSSEKQALVEARNELASKAAQTKGAPRAQFDLERRRVDGLIEALEHGQRVSPSDVDEALRDAGRPSPW